MYFKAILILFEFKNQLNLPFSLSFLFPLQQRMTLPFNFCCLVDQHPVTFYICKFPCLNINVIMARFRNFMKCTRFFILKYSRHTIICLPYFSFQNQSSISPLNCVFGCLMGCQNGLSSCILLHFAIASCVLSGNFGDSFQALPELCASCPPPPRVSCCVALSPLPWPCLLTEPRVLMAASKPL